MKKTTFVGLSMIPIFFMSGCKNFHDDILKADLNRFDYLQDTSSVQGRYTSEELTPLMSAAYVNDLALAKALIKMPAFIDINSLSANNDSALSIAAGKKSYDVFKYLIQVGAKLDEKSVAQIDKDPVLKKITNEREEYISLSENSSYEIFIRFFGNYPNGYYSSVAFDKFLPVLQEKIKFLENKGSLDEIDIFIKELKKLKKTINSKNYTIIKKELKLLIRKQYIALTNKEFKEIYKNPTIEKLEQFLHDTIFIDETVELGEKASLLIIDLILKEAQSDTKSTLSENQKVKSLNSLQRLIEKYENSQEKELKDQAVLFKKLYKTILLKSL